MAPMAIFFLNFKKFRSFHFNYFSNKEILIINKLWFSFYHHNKFPSVAFPTQILTNYWQVYTFYYNFLPA